MKTQTRDTYVKRIDRAVAMLQQAIDRGDDLPDPMQLAEAAHLSAFHFHRIYRALTGETPGNTVARLRMLRALRLLADQQIPVTEAALSAGYETPQSFARALRQWCGASPSELRGATDRLRALAQQFERAPATPGKPATPLQVEVVSLEPFRVMAIRNRGDYADLDQAYSQLFAWAAERGVIEQVIGIWGLPWQDHRDALPAELEYECALQIGVAVDGGEGVQAQDWGGGLWARAHHVGAYEALEDFTDACIAHWLPDSAYRLRDAAIVHHYLDDPEATPASLCRADVYLPIA